MPKRDDFVIMLRRMLESLPRCSDATGEYIDIVSQDIHDMVGYGSKVPIFPVCCSVMNETMIPGDDILCKANTREGYTSAYKVRYRFPRII